MPINAAEPSSDERGTMRPENWMVGRLVMIMVPRIAAIWVRVNADISSPMLVVDSTYKSPPRANVSALPLNGTPNSQRFMATSKARLTRLTAR